MSCSHESTQRFYPSTLMLYPSVSHARPPTEICWCPQRQLHLSLKSCA